MVKDLSFTIEPGEMIGIVGHSGAGKTTLINLLCRFYDVTGGAIRIDGTDVRDLPMSEVRRQIGMVLQSPFLFRGTLGRKHRLWQARCGPRGDHSRGQGGERARLYHAFARGL